MVTRYADTQLERDWWAAVAFIAADPGRIERSLSRHRPDGRGRCVDCRISGGPWPCVLSRLTQAAIERFNTVPTQREATP